ncbi:MAG: redoxin family protein [Planctomycetes bacterium]|nr:redoxin family protein [Planctomycetota bacterium]
MTRILAVTAAVALLIGGAAWADDEPQSDEAKTKSTAEQLKENPDNPLALQTYVLLQARQILPLVESDPDQAEKRLGELRAFINSLEPKAEEAQEVVERAQSYVQAIEQRLKLARTTLEQLVADLKENPGDADLLSLYQSKAMNELYPLAMYQLADAEEKLAATTAFLGERREAAEEADVKTKYDDVIGSLEREISQALERGRELAKTLGKPAAPLDAEAWVNGEPLTEKDLKGKVVLLDFWAVWCGPCIATFPHLREWQERYADEGLQIIGLTRYYNYAWDEDAQRATRAEESVTAEEEQEMLRQFAEHHELEHRFAIRQDDSLTDYYQVSGIPHVVLLDREGKVRLYRIGSGEQNAKDIEAEIKKLLAEGRP